MMEDYIILLDFKNTFIAVSENRQHCYVTALQYLTSCRFTICGLKKIARGNSHDEDWQDKYTVIKDGGSFAEFFNKESQRKAVLYSDKPIMEYIDNLSIDEMEKWSQYFENFSGEAGWRYIYASKDNKDYIFKTAFTYIIMPNGKATKNNLYYLRVIDTNLYK